jgi:hypothetical protein
MPMLSFLILIPLMLLPWLRIARPGGDALDGRIVFRSPVPLLARMRMHAVPAAIVLLAAVALDAFGDLPWWGVLLALASVVALVAYPFDYTLTTLGIQMGRTRFRRWTEFAGVSRAPGGARLQGVAGVRDRRIWLSGSRGDDEFLALLRRMIRNAYKGQNVLQEFPPRPAAERPGSTAASSTVGPRLV